MESLEEDERGGGDHKNKAQPPPVETQQGVEQVEATNPEHHSKDRVNIHQEKLGKRGEKSARRFDCGSQSVANQLQAYFDQQSQKIKKQSWFPPGEECLAVLEDNVEDRVECTPPK